MIKLFIDIILPPTKEIVKGCGQKYKYLLSLTVEIVKCSGKVQEPQTTVTTAVLLKIK